MKQLFGVRSFITQLLCLSFVLPGLTPLTIQARQFSGNSARITPVIAALATRAPRDPLPISDGTGNVGNPPANADNSLYPPLPSDLTITGNLSISQLGLTLREDPANGQDGVTLKAAASMPASYTLTLPATDGFLDQYLGTNGSGQLFWGNPGVIAGGFVNGGNAFGGPAVLGTTDNNSLTIRTGVGVLPAQARMIFAAAGDITAPGLAGLSDRYVQADSTGKLAAILPTGIKNTIQVIKDHPTVVGKYYPDVRSAVDWANANATEPTTIFIESGRHNVDTTLAITNPFIRGIQGASAGGTILVPTVALVGQPVLQFEQNTSLINVSLQNLSVDGTQTVGYTTTPGGSGIVIVGEGNYAVINILVQGCYRGIQADGDGTLSSAQQLIINSSFILFSGDCGLLCDNGAFVTAENLSIAYSGNQEVRTQRTNPLLPMTELVLDTCWLTDDIAGTADGILAKDVSSVRSVTSRVYDVQRAFVAEGLGQIKCASNTRVSGVVQHYSQVDGTAEIQAIGDLVGGTDPAKFLVTNPDNVYFSIFDFITNEAKVGRLTNVNYNLSNVLTGNGTNDPGYKYISNWFNGAYRGEGFEIPAAALALGQSGVRGLSVFNHSASQPTLIRGLQAHQYEPSFAAVTYASDGDPATADMSLMRYWSFVKRANDHALYFNNWNGSGSTTQPFVMTTAGNLGLSSANPVSRLELGSGQISAPGGSAAAPSYSFTGNLVTGIYSPAANSIGISTNNTPRLTIGATGLVTISNLALAGGGVVHADAAGVLSSSLISGADIANNSIPDSKLQTISTAGKVANSATSASSPLTPGIASIVLRDTFGNFSANMITADLTGTVTGSVTGSATNFTGPLVGDVTGTQSATVVAQVGGVSAANVASGASAANAATSLNTINTIVKRDGSGNFSAGTISALFSGNLTGNVTGNVTGTAGSFTGSLAGDVTGGQSTTVVAQVGGVSAANVASGATAANLAVSTNTAGRIVVRDGSGNFAANTITANLTGTASGNLPLTGGIVTGPITLASLQQLRLAKDALGTNYVGLQASNAMAGAYTLTLPTSAGAANQVLTTDGAGVLSWQPTGTAAGYILNGGNTGPITIGTTNATQLTLETNSTPQFTISSGGTVGVTSLIGTGDRTVQASSAGALSALLPTGIKNVIQVIKNVPEVAGKYYNTLMAAVTWANANVSEPTAITIAPGIHTITSTITVTNPYIMTIIGEGTVASILAPAPALVGQPVIALPQNTTVCTLQNLVIDGSGVPAYMMTPGSIGVSISGTAYYGLVNVFVQGCYQGIYVDGLTAGPSETVSLTNCYVLLSGDCGILCDNGGYITGNNLTVSYAGNQDIRAQSTNTGTAQRTQISLMGSWLSGDTITQTPYGILATGNAYVLVSSSRVYNITNAFAVSGTAELYSVGNPRVSGFTTHYSQLAAGARIQAVGDVVNGVATTQFSVLNPDNVYFDVLDSTTSIRHTGKMTNTTFNLSSILTNNGTNDPLYTYVHNWFGFTGQAIQLNAAALGGLAGAQSIATQGGDAFTSSFIRGLGAHTHTAGLVLGTYDSDGDPSTPDWTLGRAWRVQKRAVDHALEMRAWNGSAYLAPFVLTLDGKLGLDATGALTTPTSQLQLGSGQIAVPVGSAAAPSYSFTGNLGTGMYAPGANMVGFATNGLSRATIDAAGVLTVPNLGTASGSGTGLVVHSNASGVLTASQIFGSDIASNTIPDSKLQTISTAGKVANGATTATTANTLNTIVLRDGVTGGFSAGTITANLTGTVTGAASLNVLKAGDTMTGSLLLSNQKQLQFGELTANGTDFVALQAPAATAGYVLTLPVDAGLSGQVLSTDGAGVLSWQNTGAAAGYVLNGGNTVTAAMSIGTDGSSSYPLNLITNGVPRLEISNLGKVTVTDLASAGLVHSDATGLLSTSLLSNSDIANNTILDSKLQTISTAGKVANGATTATTANTLSTIVLRDGVTGGFSAGTITANLTGTVTGSLVGAASLNVLKAGDTMTGPLILSGGSSNLTVGGTTNLQAAQTNGLLTVNNGVYYTNGVPCVPEHMLQVTSGTISGPNQFNSIKTAMDSISGSSGSNPYVVQVGPGLFIEDTITMKPYVTLTGSGTSATIVRVNSTAKDVIIAVANCYITDLWLEGATDTGKAAVVYHGGAGGIGIERCTFGSNDIFVNQDSTAAPFSLSEINNCTIFSLAAFTTGFKLRGSGPFNVMMQIDSLTWPAVSNAKSPFTLIDLSGSNVIFTAQGLDLGPIGNGFIGGTGVSLTDGAFGDIQSSSLHGFATAIYVPNTGAAPDMIVAGSSGRSNTADISVAHAGATGTINGVFDRTKVSIAAGSPISIFFSDPVNTGTVTAGPLYEGTSYGAITNISKQIQQGANLGLLSGGDFTEAVGALQIDVPAGDGYVMTSTPAFPNNNLKYVSWSAQPGVALTANADNYIYIDENGLALTSTSVPDPLTTIFLGKMRTDSTGEVFCERDAESMVHTASQLDYSWREALGPIYVSGSIVTQDATPLQLDVTQGRYFFGTHEYVPSGGTPIANWIAFYRNPPNNYNVIDPQTLIDYTQYDNGSGTLAAIPALNYARHAFYVVNDGANEYYLLVYGQAVYTSLNDAINGGIPPMPSTWTGNIALIASIIVQNTGVAATGIAQIRDERPRLGFQGSGITGVTNHGSLSGLANDDHTQYLLVNGTRAMSGNLQLGTNNITGVGTVNGVTVEAHASRHLPGGADPLAAGTPVAIIDGANAPGIANSFARSDHQHTHGSLGGGSDHALATPNPGGTAGFMSAADKTILDSVNPALYVLKAGDTMTGPLVFSNGSNTVGLTVPGSGLSNYTLTLPTTGGTAGYVLTTNGSGTLSWTATGSSAGYFINGGNNFGGAGPAVLGTTAAAGYGLTIISNGVQAVTTDTLGAITLPQLATAGVVHTNSSGVLSTSKVTNSDLSTVASANTPNYLVVRDGSGNFAAGTVTATGVDISGLTLTLNKGSAGSSNGAGILIDDTSVSGAGYAQIGNSRNSWVFKAPATAGVVTITPGAGGFTLDQGSHNPVTIGTANGLSLATQQLSLGTASGATTGALTSGDWTNFNSKQAGSATLTAFAAYNTNGLITQTAANTFTGRTITGTANQVLVSNGNGVSGNPTLSLPQDIATTSSPSFAGVTVSNGGTVALKNTGNINTIAVGAPAGLTGNYNFTLPIADGSSGQILSTNGAGQLGWISSTANAVLLGGNTVTGDMFVGTATGSNHPLNLITNGVTNLRILGTGEVLLPQLTTNGVVHTTGGTGLLQTSLVVDADISGIANIADSKLATISTAGKVSNSATTATASNLANTIVLRDVSGNFSAGTISATFVGNLSGTVTGHATLDVLKTGDTMTGDLVLANTKELRLSELTTNGTNFMALRAPDSVTANTYLVLPDGPGTAGQALCTDGGVGPTPTVLSWQSVQTLNANLTSLAGIATNGMIAYTGANTFASRTITGTTNQITVTNGTGATGDPTLSLPSTIVIGGVDSVATLSLGTGTATVVNLGHAAATINLTGSTTMSDKLVTLNKGGIAGSAGTAGIELEENSLITGYAQTSVDRNSWTLKAPNTAGVVTITPGAGGFTIDQGSHNPVTIGTANGLSLATQQLSLAAANGSTTGALTSGDWTTFNSKQAGSANLTSLAGIATNGMIAYTGANTFASRTITGTANQVIVTNGTGAAGNPTLSLPQDIATTSSPTFAGLTITGAGTITAGTGGVDATTLNLGTTTATTVTIGRAAATVGITGSTISLTGNTTMSDKLVTLNKGGIAGSAGTAGIELEENSLITGYAQTSVDRNSWTLKAPNTAGVVTITPGAGGFTIDQGSHNPVTIGTANGLSLSTQQLSLGTASGSTTGALTSGDWTTFNSKQAGSANLTSLAGIATNGMIAYTGANTFASRTITGTTNQITVTNGTGAAGNPTLSLPQDIATTSTPTFGGLTVNTGAINANGGIDRSSAGTLTMGTSANITGITIGGSSATGTTAVDGATLNLGTNTPTTVVNLGRAAATVGITGSAVSVTGTTTISGGASAGVLQLKQASGVSPFSVGFQAPATPALVSNLLYVLPGTSGTAGQVLSTAGGASPVTLSWSGLGTLGAFVNGGNTFGTTATLGTNEAQNLIFRTNSVDRMIIDSTGKIAIGQATVDPNFGCLINTDNLLVNSGGGTNTYFAIQKDTNLWGLMVDSTSNNVFSIRNASAGLLGTVKMQIDNTGATNMTTFNTDMTISNLSSAGVVHNSAAGVLSSSTVTNAELATATSANTANYVVVRDGSGNFSAGNITANLLGNATTATSATSFTGALLGDVTGTQSATVVSSVGGQSAANVAAGTVLANNSTSANTANQIVRRDASGNFSAGAITATAVDSTTTLSLGTNTATAVNIGTSGVNRFTIDSVGNTTYSSRYKMAAYRATSNQAIGAATAIVIFNSTTFDPNTNYNVPAAGRYTVPYTGYYLVVPNITFTTTSTTLWTSARTVWLYRNAAAMTGYAVQAAPPYYNLNSMISPTWLVSLTAGDVIDVRFTGVAAGDAIVFNYSNLQIHYMSR